METDGDGHTLNSPHALRGPHSSGFVAVRFLSVSNDAFGGAVVAGRSPIDGNGDAKHT